MADRETRPLDAGYAADIGSLQEPAWSSVLLEFDDANIYQTWQYGSVTAGEPNLEHLTLRRGGEIVALAQVRITRLPLLPIGVAYVRWGPLWRKSGTADVEVLRQAVRALRNEYVCRRRLALRLFPMLYSDRPVPFQVILQQEGYIAASSDTADRTLLLDLSPPVATLRDGMKAHWKRELKAADRSQLEIEAGTADELFADFVTMYREMVTRKGFVEPNDINQFREIQQRLPEAMKMKIVLCRAGGQTCAGAIASALGQTGVYLFGATSNAGLKSRGSYALQWRLVQTLKEEGLRVYDLNGINPEKNPGTYKFKADLAGGNGMDVFFLGRFDAQGAGPSSWFLRAGEILRAGYAGLKLRLRAARQTGLRPNPAE